MDEAVSEAVIADAIAAKEITVSEEEVQKAMVAFRSTRKLYKAKDTNAWLDQQHMTVDDLEKGLERQITISELEQAFTEDEINKYYFDNRKSFEKAKLSQILCDFPETTEEIKTQIDDEEDEDFAVLAGKYSVDKTTAEAGGFLGWVDRTALSPQVEALVFGAFPGDIVGPIESDAGWTLLKVWEIDNGAMDEDLSAAIRGALFNQWHAEKTA